MSYRQILDYFHIHLLGKVLFTTNECEHQVMAKNKSLDMCCSLIPVFHNSRQLFSITKVGQKQVLFSQVSLLS